MKNISKQAGFSLIELVVSLSIVSILTALFLANYHTINQRTDLVMTAQTMVSDIRTAQSNALGLIKYDGAVPTGGWGFFISASSGDNQYVIFADVDGNQAASSSESIEAYGAKTVTLPDKISIDGIYLADSSPANELNTIFLPPDPLTYIVTDVGTSSAVTIRLKESVNNTTKTVRINFLGLIEVID